MNLRTALSGDAALLAPRLLGCRLERQLEGQLLVGRIVETEAYDQSDPASHSYRGPTSRTEVMFGPPGRLYVYLSYGLHYCANIVVGPAGHGAAVLIRAIEPLQGAATMASRRGRQGPAVSNGPAKTSVALAIGPELNGHDLQFPPLRLVLQPPLPPEHIVTTRRIGISRAVDRPWRFYLKDSPYISRP